MLLEPRNRRHLNPTRTNRPQILSLSRNQHRRCRERNVRNRIVDLTPKEITPHKHSTTFDTNSSITASQSLSLQRSVGIRHHIPDSKIAIQLIERRRSKRPISSRTQRKTVIETLHHRDSWTERRFRA